MSRDPRHDILFEPVRIGPKTLRNRFYQVPHCTGFGVEKPWTQAAFRGMKAEGGWAAVCTEYCSINPESRRDAVRLGAAVGRRGRARAVADDRRGARARRAGRRRAVARRRVRRGPGVAARRSWRRARSRATSSSVVVPKAMDKHDIRRAQHDWVAAATAGARRPASTSSTCTARTPTCRRSSSPPSTTAAPTSTAARSRTARGSGWRRSSWSRRRSATTCAIAVRIAADTLDAVGRADPRRGSRSSARPTTGRPVGRRHRRRCGRGRLDSGPSRFFDQGYQLEWTGRAREATDKPIVGVGRFTDPDLMADLVRGGTVDLIGAARPSIADPFLPVKIERGPLRRDPRVHRLQRLLLARRSAAAIWAARRTRRPARSTAAAGIRSGSSRPQTPTGTC